MAIYNTEIEEDETTEVNSVQITICYSFISLSEEIIACVVIIISSDVHTINRKYAILKIGRSNLLPREIHSLL